MNNQFDQDNTGFNNNPNLGPMGISNPNENNSNNQNKKSNIGVYIVMIMLVLLVAGAGYYYYMINQPSKIFSSFISQVSTRTSGLINNLKSSTIEFNSAKPFVYTGELKLSSSNEQYNKYFKKSYEYQLYGDFKNEKIQASFAIKDSNRKVLEVIGLLLKDNAYLSSKELLLNTYYEKVENNIFETLKQEDFNYDFTSLDLLVQKTFKYINEGFDSSKFTKTKDTIKVNNKDIKVTSINYPVNSETAYYFSSTFLKNIQEDPEYASLIAKITKQDESTIKDIIQKTTIDKESYENMESGIISVYQMGILKEVIGFGLSNTDDSDAQFYYAKVDDYATLLYSNTKKDNYTNEQYTDIFKVEFAKSNIKGSFIINNIEQLSFDFNYNFNEKNRDIQGSIKISSTIIDEDITITIDSKNEKENENTLKGSLLFKIDIADKDNEYDNINFGFEHNYELITDKSIDTISTTDAIPYEKIFKNEDQEKVMNTLINCLKGTPFEIYIDFNTSRVEDANKHTFLIKTQSYNEQEFSTARIGKNNYKKEIHDEYTIYCFTAEAIRQHDLLDDNYDDINGKVNVIVYKDSTKPKEYIISFINDKYYLISTTSDISTADIHKIEDSFTTNEDSYKCS